MKSTTFKALAFAAAFFALCATASAADCHSGGGYQPNSNPSIPMFPPQNATANFAPTAPFNPNISNLAPANFAGPAAPQARLTVLPASQTVTPVNTAPVGRLQLASPVSTTEVKSAIEVKPAVPEAPVVVAKAAPVAEPKPTPAAEVDLSKALDPSPVVETAKIAEKLKGLVGTWLAVSRQSDGALSTVELKLDESGWGKLTVPGPDGKPSSTTRRIEFENDELKMTGGSADILLGKLVESDSRQLVLERASGQVTFVRP